MTTSITYDFFCIDGLLPRIKKIISFNDEVIDTSVLDLPSEYEQVDSETLKEFSQFILDKFNNIIENLVNSNLDQNEFSSAVQPMKTLCIMKNSCDNLIYRRENPEEVTNPFPTLG